MFILTAQAIENVLQV